jgi:hypothetical protein
MKFRSLFGIFGLVALINGGNAGAQSIRHVDCSDAPGTQFLAERARQIGDAVYPQIVQLLADGHSHPPKHLDIIFRRHLQGENSGFAERKVVFLNADFLADHPDVLDFLLVHEMTHVAQDYPNLPTRHAWQWFPHCFGYVLTHFRRYPSYPPSYWEEGIADYVCQRLGYSNQWDCAECAEEFPRYTSGYGCAAAFLLYIDKAAGADVTTHLNSALRQGTYSNGFFLTVTGESLDDWWGRFQQSGGFRPIAAQYNQLHDELGYADGKAPGNLSHQFDQYFLAHPDVGQFFSRFSLRRTIAPQGLMRLVECYLSFRQRPGGESALREIEAGVDELHQSLALTNDVPPPDLRARLDAYLGRHPNIQEWCQAHQWLDNPGPEIQWEIEDFYIARIFPGGDISISADEFLAGLKDQGRLPGWRKNEHGTASLFQPLAREAESFPAHRHFDCRKIGSRTTYHYEMVEAAAGAAWRLQRAWTTNRQGVNDELAIAN